MSLEQGVSKLFPLGAKMFVVILLACRKSLSLSCVRIAQIESADWIWPESRNLIHYVKATSNFINLNQILSVMTKFRDKM